MPFRTPLQSTPMGMSKAQHTSTTLPASTAVAMTRAQQQVYPPRPHPHTQDDVSDICTACSLQTGSPAAAHTEGFTVGRSKRTAPSWWHTSLLQDNQLGG
jgi:hypothetical protein